MSLPHLLLLCPLVGFLQAAPAPQNGQRADEGVARQYNGNGNNGWGSGFSRGGTGAMMWSGWSPRGMTAFTSTGGQLLPPSRDGQNGSEAADDGKPEERGYNGGETPRANANASFNAWFPIVLGMSGGGVGGRRSGDGAEGFGEGGYPPIAAVANSISHGARGVATSHAVAYGGPPADYGRQHRSQPPTSRSPDSQ